MGRGRAAKEWYDAARDAISPETLRAIFAAAAVVAVKGDVPAARFCAEYTVGRPREHLSLSVLDYDSSGDENLAYYE